MSDSRSQALLVCPFSLPPQLKTSVFSLTPGGHRERQILEEVENIPRSHIISSHSWMTGFGRKRNLKMRTPFSEKCFVFLCFFFVRFLGKFIPLKHSHLVWAKLMDILVRIDLRAKCSDSQVVMDRKGEVKHAAGWAWEHHYQQFPFHLRLNSTCLSKQWTFSLSNALFSKVLVFREY